MDFGKAIEALKNGHKVARKGWNGKGMFLIMTPGSDVPVEQLRSDVTKYHYQNEGKTAIKICPHIDMKAADDSLVIGWLASHTDMLSDDWLIVE